MGNPTADAAADVIAQLEGAAGTMLFCSGMAAISACLFSYLKAGDHFVRRERERRSKMEEGGKIFSLEMRTLSLLASSLQK